MSRPGPSTAGRVPGTREVVAGAPVNIVLKKDQPTGRTVSGTVQDVLTRGNHPRGIKVRLSDGRVGRVQTMARGGASAQEGQQIVLGGDGAAEQTFPSGSSYRPRQRRNEEWQAPPETQIGLDAYVKEPKPKKQGRKNAAQQDSVEEGISGASEETGVRANGTLGASEETLTCPVCGDFEGDEAAVSHHVSGHFDS